MHGSVDHKIYLQPLGFLRGCSAFQAVKEGHARWLAGGALAFAMVKIIFRQAAVRQGEVVVPIFRLADYLSDLASAQQDDISRLLEQVTTPRPALACSGGTTLDWQKPLLQGIVNVTPDSFSDGGRYGQRDPAIRHAHGLIQAGAEIIDIGGESTRPGAQKVSIQEELDRVIPVIEGLSDISAPISIDSRNAEVMASALKAGASIINDVSALTHDEAALELVAEADCPVILMHAQNSPDTMQQDPRYDDVVLDVYDYLEKRVAVCLAAGIERDRLVIDPGIGFGKTVGHNISLMNNLSLLHGLGVPILLGVSRKSFIGHIVSEEKPGDRLAGSLAFGQAGYDQGIQILRVHDVHASRQVRDIWQTLGN
ncbi:MAG: dihydropteroate synthase [Alphaproteobacteria bacterium]|nr:MAG: dihydropteroate synthase [Alphaproteobacteria bacterium]